MTDIVVPLRTLKRLSSYTPTKVHNILSWVYNSDVTQHGISLANEGIKILPEFVVSGVQKLDEIGDNTLENTEKRVRSTVDTVTSIKHSMMNKTNETVATAGVLVSTQVNKVLDITDNIVDKVLVPAGDEVRTTTGAAANKPVLDRVSNTVIRVKSRAMHRAKSARIDGRLWLEEHAKPMVPHWAMQQGEASLKWTEDVVARAQSRANEVMASVKDNASAAKLRGALASMKIRSEEFLNTMKTKAHANEGYIVVHDWVSHTYDSLMAGLRTVREQPAAQHALAWTTMQYQMIHDVLARAADVGAESMESTVEKLRQRAGSDPAVVSSAMRTVADFLDIFVTHKKQGQPMDALMEELKARQQEIRPSLSPHEAGEPQDNAGVGKASYAEAAAGNPTAFEENKKDQ